MAFMREFFAQEQLFVSGTKIAKFTDGEEKGSLVIQMAEDRSKESADAVPAIVIQDLGFTERPVGIDSRHTHVLGEAVVHKSHFDMNYAVHCIARRRGTARMLQSLASLALVMFRRALYGQGIDYLTPLSGTPPQKMSPSNSDAGPYSATITFSVSQTFDWEEVWGEELEEKISVSLQAELECEAGGVDFAYEVDLDSEEP